MWYNTKEAKNSKVGNQMAELKINGLTKKYHSGVVAIDRFNLDVADGESVAIFGLDRSGKSTLLRMIAGLEEVTEGTVTLGKRDITDLSTKDRNLAFAFRDTTLDNRVSVYDNLAFGLRARKVPEPVVDVKVKAVAELLSLSDVLLRKPKTLSVLQRRRILLGRTMTRDPEVYLFDDPLTGIDDELKKSILADLVKAQARLKATFLFATDDIWQAVTIADRIAILSEGKLVQVDTPQNLYAHPETELVAEVMGSVMTQATASTEEPAVTDEAVITEEPAVTEEAADEVAQKAGE
jgi:ABC-type sugar transport system ATPase subunit